MMMPTKRPFWPRLVAVLLAVLLGVTLAIMVRQLRELSAARAALNAPEPLPELGSVGTFRFTDSSGAAFGDGDVSGKLWIANLFFSTCGSICPPLMHGLAEVGNDSSLPPFEMVSVTVDPETDTPEVLTTYAASLGADTGRWHFLTGVPDTIKTFSVEGLRIGTHDNPLNHSSYVVLVDGAGSIRGFYDGLDGEARLRLKNDLKRLAREDEPGR
jgi:protein SCO1/2